MEGVELGGFTVYIYIYIYIHTHAIYTHAHPSHLRRLKYGEYLCVFMLEREPLRACVRACVYTFLRRPEPV